MLSYFGVWIQSVGSAWLMTSIAPTVDFVAWLQAAASLPPIIFTVFGGVLVDRFDHRLIYLIAQIIVLTIAMMLSVFDSMGVISPWLLLGLTFALESGSSLRYPAYQTTMSDVLPRDQIASALVLGSIGWNIARAAGPAIGGLIISLFGVSAAFAVNALCNIYVVFVLVQWRRRSAVSKKRGQSSVITEIWHGILHIRGASTIRSAMLRCFIFTLFASSLWALLPLVAKHSMNGSVSVYGWLLGALGAGALGAASVINRLRQRFGIRRLLALAVFCFAAATFSLGTIHSMIFLLPILAIGGLGWMVSMSTFNLLVQLTAVDGFRGRVVSIYYVALFAGLAIGSWLWGYLAERIGINICLVAAGAALFFSLALYRSSSGSFSTELGS